MSLRVFWERWKRFGRKVANFQARILLTVFYFFILWSFGLLVRFLVDVLGIKPAAKVDYMDWVNKADSLEEVRKQF